MATPAHEVPKDRWLNQPDPADYTSEDLNLNAAAGREARARAEESNRHIRFAMFYNSTEIRKGGEVGPTDKELEFLVGVKNLFGRVRHVLAFLP